MTIDYIARRALNACAAAMLAACSQSPAVPNTAPLVETGTSSSVRADAGGCPLKRCIIVGSQSLYKNKPRSSVLFFARDANGNAAPAGEIRGSKSMLAFPAGLATDSHQNIYVANWGTNTITVYAGESEGNVAPIRTISGAKTMLKSLAGIAIDSRGKLYVADNQDNRILVYARDANGDSAPIRVISGNNTQLYAPWGLAFDSQSNLYVADGEPYDCCITVYAPGANGNTTPIRTIEGSATELQGPAGLAVDASGYVYVVNTTSVNNDVGVFAPGANGNQAPVSYFSGGYGAFGIGVGNRGIYVTSVGYDDEPFIATFSAGPVGNKGGVLRKIQGNKTKLVWPEGIIVR